MSSVLRQRPRYARIEALTGDVLRRANVDAPPVPIERLVAEHGIDVRYGDLGEVSGLMVREGRSVTVGINDQHGLPRQRFTMAHEFGHFLLHNDINEHFDEVYTVRTVRNRDDRSSLAVDVDEIEANFFAATILMPKPFLDAANAIERLDSNSGVAELARAFNVSQHAMSLRLANVYRIHLPF